MQNTITVTDKFIDFTGREHQFIIAAIKEVFKVKDCNTAFFRGSLKVGVSICNPADEFNKELGEFQAIGRATKSDPILYTKYSGQITETLMNAYLQQEIKYIQNHPEKYMGGYLSAKDNYLKRQEIDRLVSNFSETESYC